MKWQATNTRAAAIRATRRAAAALVLVAAAARPCPAVVSYRSAAGEPVTTAQLLPRLRSSRYLFLGEVHGNYRDHAVQIELLRLLLDAGVPLVVGMETFTATATPELARWSAGELGTGPLYRRFEADWSLSNWPAYRDLFLFLRERRIPLAGINAEESLIRRVARGGIASLSDEERHGLPPGGCTVNPRYRALLERALGAGVMHENLFRTFCEAQTLRDAIMARHLERFASDYPGHLVVVLAGLYHAWKPAVPAQLALLTAGPALVLLPEDGPAQTPAELAPEIDYLWRWRD